MYFLDNWDSADIKPQIPWILRKSVCFFIISKSAKCYLGEIINIFNIQNPDGFLKVLFLFQTEAEASQSLDLVKHQSILFFFLVAKLCVYLNGHYFNEAPAHLNRIICLKDIPNSSLSIGMRQNQSD